MTTWHLSLAYNMTGTLTPPSNVPGFNGTLQYGYCEWNGTSAQDATDPATDPDPGMTVGTADTVYIYLYNLGNDGSTPSLSPGVTNYTNFITATPNNGNGQTLFSNLTAINGGAWVPMGTQHSAVFGQSVPCFRLSASANASAALACQPVNGTSSDQSYNVTFGIKVTGTTGTVNTFAIDPEMDVTSGGAYGGGDNP